MSTIATKKRLEGPIRHRMAVASGYTPALEDRVELTSASNTVQKIPDDTESDTFVGTIYAKTADGDDDYCIVELIFNNLKSIPSHAAIAAPGAGCFMGQKVKTYVAGSDEELEHNCMIFETATGADENVIVGW